MANHARSAAGGAIDFVPPFVSPIPLFGGSLEQLLFYHQRKDAASHFLDEEVVRGALKLIVGAAHPSTPFVYHQSVTWSSDTRTSGCGGRVRATSAGNGWIGKLARSRTASITHDWSISSGVEWRRRAAKPRPSLAARPRMSRTRHSVRSEGREPSAPAVQTLRAALAA